MTIKEMKQWLEQCDLPDDTKVVIHKGDRGFEEFEEPEFHEYSIGLLLTFNDKQLFLSEDELPIGNIPGLKGERAVLLDYIELHAKSSPSMVFCHHGLA